MFGNLVARRQLRSLIESKDLTIHPFDESSLRATHYTLRAGRAFRRDEKTGDWADAHNFKVKKPEPMVLEPDEYVLVEVKEDIKISAPGIVGRFIIASSNIEAGLLVIAGQIDNQYGSSGERVRFGVKNLLPVRNQLTATSRLAHLEFFDLRGIATETTPLTEEDEAIRHKRRARAADDDVWSAHEDQG